MTQKLSLRTNTFAIIGCFSDIFSARRQFEKTQISLAAHIVSWRENTDWWEVNNCRIYLKCWLSTVETDSQPPTQMAKTSQDYDNERVTRLLRTGMQDDFTVKYMKDIDNVVLDTLSWSPTGHVLWSAVALACKLHSFYSLHTTPYMHMLLDFGKYLFSIMGIFVNQKVMQCPGKLILKA